MTTRPGSDAAGSFDAAWEAALGELELDAARADAVLAAVRAGQQVPQDWHATWAPPRDLGPLPAALGQRARLLLQRQIATSRELALACARAGEAIGRGERRMSGRSQDPSVPVFVDATA